MIAMFWYNGELKQENTISLNIAEPGLIYGATVFTTLRVYQESLDHPLTQWKAHCDRLESSLKAFDWTIPNWQQIQQQAEVLVPHYPVLRLTIFPDGKELITGRFLPQDLPQSQQQGIKGWVANNSLYQRSLPNHKTGNYLGAFLALQQAKKLGFREAILIDDDGNWLETATGNLWGYKQGIWYTPQLKEGILPGIGRSQLISWLKNQQIEVKQTQWNTDLIERLEIIAYGNSVFEIIPFSSITMGEKQLILNPSHPSLKQVRDYYQIGF
ncbi:aminotransferase class IV [Rippkaea orientalis PCC 8801]|uniref:Aminotransferase class IV n=1 Tax=Rippkaea orientalis (strain PCC 8801 / RF-1) TaxID=41431 RepID=B7JV96_RIPO1|nr:aminotransferase class IV [Rippkaea orientalis]ACK68229.1 aminotransferase class IV [Rippkaea orientalis PCC 8801]